tara:strand:- start:301 stop:1053 length:753 start_codon:yes stop_codon:yes gene_type:complete
MAGPNDFTGQNIQDTYQRVLQVSSSGQITDGTGSLVLLDTNAVASSSFAVTASFAVSASHEITFELSSSHAQTADTASFVDSTTLDTFKTTGVRSGDGFIDGNITASGNISASGNLEISSSITFGDGIAKIIGPGNNDYIQLSTDNVDFYLNGAEIVSFEPDQIIMNASSQNINFSVAHDAPGIAAIQTNASANRVKIRDFVTIGSGSAPNADPNALLVSGSSQFTSHITASGNISASGDIIGTINGGNF